MLPDEPPRPPPGEDAAAAPAQGDSPPEGAPGHARRRRRSRRGGRRHREGRHGDESGPAAQGGASADDAGAAGLAPEADAFEPPPLPGQGAPPTGGEAPTRVDAGEGAAPSSDDGGDGATRRRRRRGGRRRGGREREPRAVDGEGGGIGPEADAGPTPLGEPAAAEVDEPRERSVGEPRERRRGRRELRRERHVRRARDEEDLLEVHEAGLPAPEEGEEPQPAPTPPIHKTLLINATDPEEVRIALLEDGKLEEIYLETGHERSAAGNIYRGRVQNVERGIGAAFVDLGRGLMGFLHVSDLPDRPAGKEEASVTELLEPGQEVLVQITRDSIGRKGPALTGRISLPGRYLVLTPNSDRTGVSRRIGHGSERDRMRQLLRDLEVPEGMGVIVRTAGESQPLALLKADLKHLMEEWEALKVKAGEAGIPGLLRGESDVAERCVRDIMPADVSRVFVDDARMAQRIRQLLDVWYPQTAVAPPPPAEPSAAGAAAVPAPTPGVAVAPPPAASPAVASPAVASPAIASPAIVSPAVASPAIASPAIGSPAEGPAPVAPPPPQEVEDGFGAGLIPPLPADEEGPAPEADVEPPPLPSPPPPGPRAASAPPPPAEPAPLPFPPKVELWDDPMPLFHAQGVETQLEDALRRTSRLPSGGSIVIDPTEALVAIDVNSGRLTDEEDPERTALVTNLEAVAEVTRQLRLRDLGGLIVIDFIDMRDRKAVRKVERELRRALVRDRARIRVDRIGPFGCVMLSRQRIRQALQRVTHEECSACGGTGRRRLLSGLSLRVLREVQARVARSRGRGGLEVRVPPPVAEWLKKHRSTALRDLRQVCTGPIRLEADPRLAADGWAMRGLPPGGEPPAAVGRP